MNDPTILRQICTAITRAIAVVHDQTPELLVEKCRALPWQHPAHTQVFIEKLSAKLAAIATTDQLIQEIEKVLKLLLLPAWFESVAFPTLTQQVRELLHPDTTQPVDPTTSQPASTETFDRPKTHLSEIAILLLDAENLQPDLETEKFLANTCTHPLRVKIAFANWRKLGKYDQELHDRGYDLMHVPSGNDMADGKMIAIGSSIHEHYPTAREILVCSSDKVMTSLCTKLRQKGLIVYQVRKQNDAVTILNSETGEIKTYPDSPAPEIPTLEEGIAQLKLLIQAEQARISNLWIRLSRVSQLFKQHTGITISQMLSTYCPGKKARDLFTDRPTDFVVHQPSEETEPFITLFELPIQPANSGAISLENNGQGQSVAVQTSSDLAKQPPQPQTPPLPQTAAELEQSIVELLKPLAKATANGWVDINVLGTQFYRVYQQPITAVIKKLAIPQKYSAFLRSCKTLKAQQQGTTWQVGLK
ncbi:NYN domain-containing protein [Pantanalinema rosaneae CENA516]|uniref:NYN domain-containing protein n=1 Tax=Pantanalinema rosaneae TaxID=1620701 RepID=UPI003D6E6B91